MRLRQRVRQSSHDFKLSSLLTDTSGTDSEVNVYDGKALCSLCEAARAQCLTAARRSEITSGEEPLIGTTVGRLATPIPSECTCNNVYFKLWSACATVGEDNLPPTYGEWVTTCKRSSIGFFDTYPDRWVVKDDSGFDSGLVIRDTKSSMSGETTPIVASIVGIVGITILGTLGTCLYWFMKRSAGENFTKFWRRRLLRGAEKVQRASRTDHFEIDYTTEDAHGVAFTESTGYHSRHPSSESMKTATPEYHFPFRNVWRNSQIIQYFRRIPDRVPFPFTDRPVQIRPSTPGIRFRVDPSGSSAESSGASAPGCATTVEGGHPDTIFEDDEYADNEPGYRNSYYGNEETSLITPTDRHENDVFLISHRPSFTLSSNSHHVTVVPPTPTDSSRLSEGHVLNEVSTTTVQPRPPLIIPPVPRMPPPLPPGAAPKPNTLHGRTQPVHVDAYAHEHLKHIAVTKDILPKTQTDIPPAPRHPDPWQLSNPQHIPSHLPPPPAPVHYKQTPPSKSRPDTSAPLISHAHAPHKLSVDEATDKVKAKAILTKGRSDTLAPIPPSTSTSTPSSSSPSYPGHAPQKPSVDSLNNANTPRRPMGARLPSSPRHIARQISLDEEMGKFGPTTAPGTGIMSGESVHTSASSARSVVLHQVNQHGGFFTDDSELSPAVPSEESMFLGSPHVRTGGLPQPGAHRRKVSSGDGEDTRVRTGTGTGTRIPHGSAADLPPGPALDMHSHAPAHSHPYRKYPNDNVASTSLNARPRPALSPPPMPAKHSRNDSMESLVSILPGDGRMLYPGPVRAAGYNVHLPPDATDDWWADE